MVHNQHIDIFVGGKLKARRKQLKMSQSDLAEQLGLSYQQVQKYECGHTALTIHRIFEMAHILGVKPEYFYEGVPKQFYVGEQTEPGMIQDRRIAPLQLLLVEDSTDDDLIFRSAIKRCDEHVDVHSIHESERVMDYLSHCEEPGRQRPDVIILDLSMPKLDGLSLLKQIKRTQSLVDIPVVILTNSVLVKEMREAYTHNASGFIRKSFDFDDFCQTIRGMITYWSRSVVLPAMA